VPRENYISVPVLYSPEGWLISVVSTSTPESAGAGKSQSLNPLSSKGKSQWVSSSRSSRGKLLSSKVFFFFEEHTHTHHRSYSSMTS